MIDPPNSDENTKLDLAAVLGLLTCIIITHVFVPRLLANLDLGKPVGCMYLSRNSAWPGIPV